MNSYVENAEDSNEPLHKGRMSDIEFISFDESRNPNLGIVYFASAQMVFGVMMDNISVRRNIMGAMMTAFGIQDEVSTPTLFLSSIDRDIKWAGD